MAVTAGNGGLIPWQSGWATSIGRFQFVLGRELGITFYGFSGDDRVVAPSATPGGPASRRLQVDLVRSADPGIPALPVVCQQPELERAVPALRRCRRAGVGERRKPGRGSERRSSHRLFRRTAHGLRLALLPVIAQYVSRLCRRHRCVRTPSRRRRERRSFGTNRARCSIVLSSVPTVSLGAKPLYDR